VQVFISWSKPYSQQVARVLAPWLSRVLQTVTPFVSTGIDAGARWLTDINRSLDQIDFGILCVTAENQSEPWLNFEAGALAKKLDQARVVPLCIDLTPNDLLPLLGQFQGKTLSREDIEDVVLSINRAAEHSLDEPLVRESVGQWWLNLSAQPDEIHASQRLEHRPAARPRSLDDKVDELLSIVRQLA
jgi:hypothetical protein